MNVRQLILAVADFFEADPKRWTQRAIARAQSGRPVSANDPEAVCWCLMGALDKVSNDGGMGPGLWWTEEIVGMLLPWNQTWADYNDAPDQTLPKILDRCRKVAA